MKRCIALSLSVSISFLNLAQARPNPGISKIYVVLNLTGLDKMNSIHLRRGFEIGLEDWLRAHAESPEVQYLDDRGTISGAIEVVRFLKGAKDVGLVITGYSSFTSVQIAKRLPSVPIFSLFASSSEVVSNPKNHIRFLPDSKDLGKTMFRFANERLKVSRPCIIYEGDDGYSVLIYQSLKLNAFMSKLEPVACGYDWEEFDRIKRCLSICYQNRSDVIFHSGSAPSVRVLLEEHLLTHPQIPIIGSDGWGDTKLDVSANSAAVMKKGKSAVYLAYYWDSNSSSGNGKKFIQKFKMRFDSSPHIISFISHDAALLSFKYIQSKEKDVRRFLNVGSKYDFVLLKSERSRVRLPIEARVYRLYDSGRVMLEQ